MAGSTVRVPSRPLLLVCSNAEITSAFSSVVDPSPRTQLLDPGFDSIQDQCFVNVGFLARDHSDAGIALSHDGAAYGVTSWKCSSQNTRPIVELDLTHVALTFCGTSGGGSNMHKFFQRRDGDFPFQVPRRVYALLIDGQDGEYVLYDAVDAAIFDQFFASPYGPLPQPGSWRNYVDSAPIFAVEINASDGSQPATAWLAGHPIDTLPQWSEIELLADRNGEAAVYDNIAGPTMRATASVRPVSATLEQALLKATDLTPEVTPDADT
jgi:hypothetical protein